MSLKNGVLDVELPAVKLKQMLEVPLEATIRQLGLLSNSDDVAAITYYAEPWVDVDGKLMVPIRITTKRASQGPGKVVLKKKRDGTQLP